MFLSAPREHARKENQRHTMTLMPTCNQRTIDFALILTQISLLKGEWMEQYFSISRFLIFRNFSQVFPVILFSGKTLSSNNCSRFLNRQVLYTCLLRVLLIIDSVTRLSVVSFFKILFAKQMTLSRGMR